MFRFADWLSCGPCKRRMEKLSKVDDLEESPADQPAPERERRYPAVLTGGMGSSSCTIFRNGSRVVSGNGMVVYTAPDGVKTEEAGNGYSVDKEYHDDDSYDVHIKVYPSGKMIP